MREYYETSSLTGKTYDLFKCIKLLNVKQVAFYLSKGVELLHLEVSKDYKTSEPVLVFYFDKEATKDAYDEWCRRKQDVDEY